MLGELRELYQEVILDHGKHPRNHRHPADANREAKGYNPLCGDRVTVYLTLDEAGLIRDAAFEGKGCAISQASASMMTEILQGRSSAEAAALFAAFHDLCTRDGYDPADHPGVDPDAMERLAVLSGVREFPARVKCATLAWHAMDAALKGGGKVKTE
jgi:nitrogen fixation NifU-like protein